MDEIRICKKHGSCEHRKYHRKDGKLGYRWQCLKCKRAQTNKFRDNKKQQLVDYKGGKCQLCGYNTCLDALVFHHLKPEEKSFELNKRSLTKSIARLKKEADKCALLCHNCHTEVHAKIKTI